MRDSVAAENDVLPPPPAADAAVTTHAPAKLNLGLRVFPRRPDGFHDIESWFVPISLCDTLIFHQSDALTLTLSGLASGLSAVPEDNLVGRAAIALAKAAKVEPRADIHLHKLIPAGGGLGGGSSDAAATLLALRQLWNLSLGAAELLALAVQLGSDVPFFIHGQSAICRGRGERITPLPLPRLLFAVLVIPPYGTSTKEVYQTFDYQPPSPETAAINWEELARQEAAHISAAIRNDLEASAFAVTPALRDLSYEMRAITNRPVHVSGSGSTLFILADQPAAAESLADSLQQALHKDIRVVPVQIEKSAGE
ncbi:MAG: 4-(cytidine 5'-diphospho)-2-C-methyl-D-erythritol kinase, partial [Phycisphaerae bacterium]